MTESTTQIELDGSVYKVRDSFTLKNEGNTVVAMATKPESNVDYKLIYSRLKGSTPEEILKQAICHDGVSIKNDTNIRIEENILNTYDLYEFKEAKRVN